MANLKSLLPALILIAVPAAAHADEAPAQTGANTNGNNIEMSLRMRKAPIELRETELGARIGVGTVAGQDVGTVSANARRIYYINGSINGSDGDSSGVMIDPGIAVRIDGNRDGKITRQEIEASGFAVYRVRNVGNIHRELNAAEKALFGVDWLLSRIASLTNLVVMALIVCDVFGRYTISRPLPWVYDIVSIYVVNLVLYFMAAEVLRTRSHIELDLSARLLPKRAWSVLQGLAWLAVAFALGLAAWRAARTAAVPDSPA